MPLPKVCWSGNEVYSPLPLHPYHSIATLEWHCSVNLHICDALQWPFGGTLHCHSNATPKAHSNATPECTLHCHSVITTPMVFSKYTPMPLRSVFGVLICICATHSYATPMPLHKVGVALQCTLRSMEIVHSIDTPKPLYCHCVRVRASTYTGTASDLWKRWKLPPVTCAHIVMHNSLSLIWCG